MRDKLLARAARPLKQHCRIRGRRLLNHPEHLLHGGRIADDAVKSVFFVELGLETLDFGLKAMGLEGLFDPQFELVEVHRLRQEVIGPVLHGCNGLVYRPESREEHHREIRV